MTDLEAERRRNLEQQFGPAATHSDYKIGDTVRWRVGLRTITSTIVWVTDAPGELAPGDYVGRLRYIVLEDSWPVVLTGSDIVTQSDEEPSLRKCPWCSGWHTAGQEQHCPFNPDR